MIIWGNLSIRLRLLNSGIGHHFVPLTPAVTRDNFPAPRSLQVAPADDLIGGIKNRECLGIGKQDKPWHREAG